LFPGKIMVLISA